MALSIKTEEADHMARKLAAITGETMTEAVTRALKERLARLEKARKKRKADLPGRIMETAAALREEFDIRPVSKDEWDQMWGEQEKSA